MPERFIRISLEKTPRGWPMRGLFRSWSFWAITIYFSLLLIASLIGRFTSLTVITCMFRLTTGKPCVGCGSTRIVFGLFEGEVWSGFLLNPLMFIVMLIGLNLLLLKLIWGRRVRLRLARPVQIGLWVLGSLLFFANWAWVWSTHPPI